LAIELRIGNTNHILMYGGHIGYGVEQNIEGITMLQGLASCFYHWHAAMLDNALDYLQSGQHCIYKNVRARGS